MAKVVLVWNEHPTEVIAGFHARKVAAILRKKYGHEVVMEKIPIVETNYGIVKRLPLEKIVGALDSHLVFDSNEQARRKGNKHNAFAFNFHSTPSHVFGRADNIPASDFRLVERKWDPLEDQNAVKEARHNEIILMEDEQRQSYVVEVPAYYEELQTKTAEQTRTKAIIVEKLARNDDKLLRRGEFPFKRLIHSLRSVYHECRTPLHHPEQAKFKDITISEKIAEAIHRKITSQPYERQPFYDF